MQKEKHNKAIVVDADNIFLFGGSKFRIPYKNKNYRVKNSYRNGYNYENECIMTLVYPVIEYKDNSFEVCFNDENGETIKGIKLLNVIGGEEDE